jgi:endonuclease YncB( thermonuclease family)
VILGVLGVAAPNNPADALPPKAKWLPKPFKPKPFMKPKPKPFVKYHVKPIVKGKVHVVHPTPVRVPVPVFRTRVIAPRIVPPVMGTPIETLPTVPAKEIVDVQAYKVVGFDENYFVTLLVDGQATPVRMLGVEPALGETPEDRPGTLPKDALRFGQSLLVNESVYVVYDSSVQQRDADGNLLAYLYRASDNLLVNLEMIRKGYGVAAEDYAFEHQELFLANEQEARRTGKGVWTTRANAEH